MESNFSRSLSLIRQERKISQRQAAKDMGISQALLSHYENGVREPGLQFIIKACDYYHVSADFLLGRSLSREGVVITTEELYDAAEEKNNVMRGSLMATLNRKLLVNSVSVLFDLLGRVGNRAAIQAASEYLGNSVYRLFRHLHRHDPTAREDFFALDGGMFTSGACRVDATLAEMDFIAALDQHAKEKKPFPSTCNDALAESYPATYQSLFQVIHNTGSRVNQALDEREQRRAQGK